MVLRWHPWRDWVEALGELLQQLLSRKAEEGALRSELGSPLEMGGSQWENPWEHPLDCWTISFFLILISRGDPGMVFQFRDMGMGQNWVP